MRVCWQHCINLKKSQLRVSQSKFEWYYCIVTYRRIECESCSKLIKKKLARRPSIILVHLQLGMSSLYTLFQCFCRFRQVNFSRILLVIQGQNSRVIIMQPARKLQLTATKATSKILRFSFPENKSGAIRTDSKVNSLLLYHLCIMITIFKLANIIFNIFNRKTSFESVILSKFQQ